MFRAAAARSADVPRHSIPRRFATVVYADSRTSPRSRAIASVGGSA